MQPGVVHADVHRQLRQVERRRKVEGFHRERWGSCALSQAMDMYHYMEERCSRHSSSTSLGHPPVRSRGVMEAETGQSFTRRTLEAAGVRVKA
jgi:hypothetical protein